jgi:endonuclease/exonuclease/phosphatase (EEP) superfamily protein YafD
MYNNTKITIFVVHTEWFGDPSIQIQYAFDQANAVTGPVILMGDFNVGANGGNDAAPDADAFSAIPDGFHSAVNPNFNCTLHYEPDLMIDICTGPVRTEAISDYQLDYLFYRNLTLIDAGVGTDQETDFCSDHNYVWAHFTTI